MTAYLPVLAVVASLLVWPPRVAVPRWLRTVPVRLVAPSRASRPDDLAWVEALVA